MDLARQRAESDLELSSQKERLELARRSLKRVDTLHSNKMISEKEQDETRTTARLAQLDYDIAAEQQRMQKYKFGGGEKQTGVSALSPAETSGKNFCTISGSRFSPVNISCSEARLLSSARRRNTPAPPLP